MKSKREDSKNSSQSMIEKASNSFKMNLNLLQIEINKPVTKE